MPIKTYRYAICGGGNLVLDMLLYFLFYHFVFFEQNFTLGFLTISSHIITLFTVFPITFTSGFLLNKYITFPDSNISGNTQFVRYFLVSIGAIIISYLAMKLFVDVLGFYPTPSKMIAVTITVIYSYFLQSKFSFGVVKKAV